METELFSLTGRVVAVTGAAGLLGRQHARALAAAGASLALGDLDGEGAARLADEVSRAHGVRAFGGLLDVTDPESVEAFRDEVLAWFGRLDVLVNNAALNDRVEGRSPGAESAPFDAFPLEAWRHALDVNVTGVFLCCKTLGPLLAGESPGSVVNVASTYGLVGPDQRLYVRPDGTRALWKSPAYAATKGAVLALTRHLAALWGERGVRVNALVPGGVENGQEPWFVEAYADRTPLKRMASPEEYRGALVFLASDASRYMTGAALVVDGGYTAW